MKHLTLFILINLSFVTTFAQTQTISNQHDFGTSSGEGGLGSIICQDGGVLLYCVTGSLMNGTKTSPSYGGADIWLIKLDQNNNYLWDKSFGGSNDERVGGVIELNNGDLLIGGTTRSPISGNQTVGTKGLNDYWIIKLTSNGDEIWQKSFGGTDNESVEDLVQLNEGKYLVTGVSLSGISGDKTEVCKGSSDTWSIMIDSFGNLVWDKTFGGSLEDSPVKLAYKLGDDKFYLLTNSNSNTSGDKTENCFGALDAWILEIDTNSYLLNQKTIGGTNDDAFNSMLIQQDTTLLLCGGSSSGVSGNKISPISGPGDAWLLHLSSNLVILEDICLGGDNSESFQDVIKTSNNEIILIGGSNTSNSGMIQETCAGGTDCWMVSLDENFNVNYNELIGASNDEEIVGVFERNHNNYTVVSATYSSVSGDKTVPNFGSNSIDFWVFDLSTNLSVGEKTENEQVRVFPNPNNGTFKLQGLETNTVVVVTDMSGKVILEEQVQTPNEEIKLNKVNAGMYLVHLKGSNNTRTLKFVIE